VDVKRKEQRELEKMKQKIELLQSKAFEESLQNYERSVFNDARKMFILQAFLAILETYTQQEKPAPSLDSCVLPYLDDPLPVANTPLEVPGVPSTSLQADVLLVTVTEIETKAVLHAFTKKYQRSYERHCIGIKTYYELGIVNDARIFLVQSEMGVGGTGSSLSTVHEGIQVLRPSNVIMVGIAFGVDNDKQHIGDVLVSRQLCGYELQRYGTDCEGKPAIISRGDRVTASAKLLDRFRSGSLDWPSQRGCSRKHVHFGTILSGETLVDNIDYRKQLCAFEPEAIGGEMEGIGLYTAAQNAKVDWIIVKGICDWADGNKSDEKMVSSGNSKNSRKNRKDHNQKRAAKNAAQLTLHVLDKTRLV